MTLIVPQGELLAVGETTLFASEIIVPTPEEIGRLSKLGEFVVAQRVDPEGQVAMAPKRVSGNSYPTRPSDEEQAFDSQALGRYHQQCANFVQTIKKGTEQVQIPPIFGHVRAIDNDAYFHLLQPKSNIPNIISYPVKNHPFLYRFQLATIVE